MTNAQNAVDDHTLRELSLFAGFDDKQLATLASLFTPLDVPADTEIFREGGDADYLYILLQGRVVLSKSTPGRMQDPAPVSTLSRGQLLGWSALLPDSFWQATAHAFKPSLLIRVSGPAIRDLCERDPEIGYRIMKAALATVGQRLSDSRLQALDIFGKANG